MFFVNNNNKMDVIPSVLKNSFWTTKAKNQQRIKKNARILRKTFNRKPH